MVWGFGWWGGNKAESLTPKQKQHAQKRCKAFLSGLEGCRRANKDGDVSVACKHLELRVVSCMAEQHAKAEGAEHKKCYSSIYSAGSYKGLGHCKPYEEAMKKVLITKGLYPI